MKTPIKTTSRRRFGKVLAALTAAAVPAAEAQQKPQAKQAESDAEEELPPPCSVKSGLAEYDIPRDTEPSFTFRA